MIKIDSRDEWKKASRAEGVLYTKDGNLTLGIPEREQSSYQYIIYFNNTSGSYVRDYANPSDTIPISGSYHWDKYQNIPFLMLEGGKIALPARKFFELTGSRITRFPAAFLSALIYLPQKNTQNIYLFAQRSSQGLKWGIDNKQRLFVQFIGNNYIQTVKSDFSVPLRHWVPVTLAMTMVYRRYHDVKGAFIAATQSSEFDLSYIGQTRFFLSDVGADISGHFGIASLIVSDEAAAIRRGFMLKGYWVSDVYSFPNEKQVYLLTVKGTMMKGNEAQVIIEAADNPMMIGATKTGAKLEPNRETYAVKPIHGKNFRVSISFRSQSVPSIIDSLTVRMADYPLAIPNIKPPAPAPGNKITGQLTPSDLDYTEIVSGLASGAQYTIYSLEGSWGSPPSDHQSFQSLLDDAIPIRWGKLWMVRSTWSQVPDWLTVPGPFALEINGKLLIQEEGTYSFGLDLDGSMEIYLDDELKIAAYNASKTGEHPSWPVRSQVKLDSGVHDIRIVYIGESGSFSIGFGQHEGLSELSLTSLLDASLNPSFGFESKGDKFSATIWSTTDFMVRSKKGTSKMFVPAQNGWPQHGWSARREFVSPYLINPPLKPAGHVNLSGIVHDPVADARGRLFVVDRRGIAMAFDPGLKGAWARFLGEVVEDPRPVGAPCVFKGLVVIPTSSGLVALETETGGLRWVLTRTGARPISFVSQDSVFLYVVWSDGAASKIDENGQICRLAVTDALEVSHVDIEHGDASHADVLHVDIPHGDSPHEDREGHRDKHRDQPGDDWYIDFHEDAGESYLRVHRDESYQEAHKNWVGHSESWHGDHPHTDTSHQDVPHADQNHADVEHADVPHEQFSGLTISGKGSGLEIGFRRELVFWIPSGAVVLNEDLSVKHVILAKAAPITWVILNDELGSPPATRSLGILESNGLFRIISAEDGDIIAETQLDSPAQWCIPIGNGWLVACGSRLMAFDSIGTQVLTVDFGNDLTAVPVADREGKLFLGTSSGVVILNGDLSVGDEIPIPGGVERLIVWKDGDLLAVNGQGLYVLSGASERPCVGHLIYPRNPREGEQVWLMDRSQEHSTNIASSEWLVAGEVHKAKVKVIRFPWSGCFRIEHVAYNEQGQGTKEVIPVYVSKAVVEDLPRRAYIMACDKQIWVTGGEKDMLIIPPLGLDEIYRDERVKIMVDLRGAYSDLSDAVVRLVFKAEEDEDVSPVLTKDLEIVDPSLGLAEVVLEPADLKTMDPGQRYFWAITVQKDQIMDTVARGTTLVREGMS